MNAAVDCLREDNAPAPAACAQAEGDDLPLIVLQRRSDWHLIDLAELVAYRELLFFLIWRDIKLRYRQTVLGVAWAVLQPFATMLAFCLFLNRLAGPQTGAAPYPLFVFSGLLPWTFLATAVGSASQSIVFNQNLVTKVYFPRLLIPMGAVGAALVDLLVASGMLGVLLLFYGVRPGWGLLLVPALVAGLMATALGVGTLLAALSVRYRDFRYTVPFLIQFWMFATPSIYLQADAGHPWLRVLLPLNPAHGLIAHFRLAVTGAGEWEPAMLLTSVGVGLLGLLVGGLYFRRVERSFADIV
jgi:lipopolysaccharide transport system permease protein